MECQRLLQTECNIYLQSNVLNTTDAIHTAAQGSAEWLEARRNRLTASNFGAVCRMRETTSPAKTVQRLLYNEFKGNSATRYGSESEDQTEAEYIEHLKQIGSSNVVIEHPGLVPIPESPMLGASPDGVVRCTNPSLPERFAVEYKNPLSLIQKKLSVQQAATEKGGGFPLKYNEKDGKFYAVKSHHYYYQVMGVMAATKTTMCHLVVRGYESMAVATIEFDHVFFSDMKRRLLKFYHQAILPELACPRLMKGLPIRPEFVNIEFEE